VRFFIDHNLSPQLVQPLVTILPDHTFTCAINEGLAATDDIPLFTELVERDFEVIITRDRNQLADPDERAALRASGLRWLGVKDTHVPGLLGIALDSAAITVGLVMVLPDLRTGQCAFRFPAVPHQRGQRAKPLGLEPRPPRQQDGAAVTPAT
jgi:hypothetical protein